MSEEMKSTVFLHADGYIELVLMGVVPAEEIRSVVKQIKALLEERGSASLLVDGRSGRVERDAASFSAMLSIGRIPSLKQMLILTTSDPDAVDAIHGPGLVTSVLTSALGFRPTYLSDEVEARAKAKQ